MGQSLFKKLLILITFTILLIAIVVRFDGLSSSFVKGLNVMQPIILGAAIAFVLNRPFKFLFKFYTNSFKNKLTHQQVNSLALATTYLLFLGIIIALIAFVIPQFSQSIQLLYSNMDNYLKNLQYLVEQATTYLQINNLDLTRFEASIEKLPSVIGTSITGLLPGVYNFTTNLISSIVNIVLGLILSIYILSDKEHLKRQGSLLLETYIDKTIGRKILKTASVMNKTFGNFVIGQLTEACILGLLCFFGMLVLKFEYAVLISVLVGVTSLIPIVGAAIGLIPSIFILLLVNPSHALGFLIFIIVLMQFEGNLIYPRVVGGSIGLPSLWVLTSLIVGGGLFGILGMIIGIPMASVVYQLIKEDIQHRKMQHS